ncbi:MAG: phosphoglucosamine mutase, partial [Deltaproteobacteria bacterium]
MSKIFGTDGIRGTVNTFPITPEAVIKIGVAIADVLGADTADGLKIIIGKDTRLSSNWIESAIVEGICSRGINVIIAGVLPTPAVAYLTKDLSLCAGIVISASHNPFNDNGIKIFLSDGNKLSQDLEVAIEKRIFADDFSQNLIPSQNNGVVNFLDDASSRYASFLLKAVPVCLKRETKIVLDCANGATSFIAHNLFSTIGAEVIVINDNPDGRNINDNCGSQYPQSLSESVIAERASCGFAFDGDGDRVIAVDEQGKTLTGDQILTICGAMLKQEGKLKNNIIVRTVMSNFGMTHALQRLGIDSKITAVGDKHVAEELKSSGAIIGGEDSGHIIFAQYLPTGDGMLTALQVLAAMQKENKSLSELASIMSVLPQVLINVETRQRYDFMAVPEIAKIIYDV